jgi:hypothetical protein
MKKDAYFKIVGRYRNRRGWYEVIDVSDNKIRIKYEDNDEVLWMDDLEILERIDRNIRSEESILMPHERDDQNRLFFRTIGYLVKHSFIEAIIPPKSKDGFDSNYFAIKGQRPRSNQSGYYIHHDDDVDKWGVEMRLTFEKTDMELNFGDSYNIVNDPGNDDKLRINSNALCYDLLRRGFDLGEKQNLSEILSNIPHAYIEAFNDGLTL